MEFVKGIKISECEDLRAAGFDTPSSGRVFIRAIIKQVLIDGFFHGDPHPGNVLADPAVEADRLPGLRARRAARTAASGSTSSACIYAIKEVDIEGIADGLLALGKPTATSTKPEFRADIDRLARQYLVYGKVTSVGERDRAVPGRRLQQRPACSTAS